MSCRYFTEFFRAFSLFLVCIMLALSSVTVANARFLTPDTWDPMLVGVDINRYAYAGNDPINNSDANGHYMEGKDGDHTQSMSDSDLKNYHEESKIVKGVAEKFNNHPDKPAHISNMSTNDVRQNLRQSTAVGNEQFNRHIEYGSLAIGGVGTIRLGVLGVKAGIAAFRSGPALAKNAADAGEFSITSWKGYPPGVPKPSGSVKVLSGEEYRQARAAADAANKALRRADPAAVAGKQLHEVKPVKFNGSPTDPLNKIPLDPPVHYQVNKFWNSLQRYLEGR